MKKKKQNFTNDTLDDLWKEDTIISKVWISQILTDHLCCIDCEGDKNFNSRRHINY